jgi:hypothetical protein
MNDLDLALRLQFSRRESMSRVPGCFKRAFSKCVFHTHILNSTISMMVKTKCSSYLANHNRHQESRCEYKRARFTFVSVARSCGQASSRLNLIRVFRRHLSFLNAAPRQKPEPHTITLRYCVLSSSSTEPRTFSSFAGCTLVEQAAIPTSLIAQHVTPSLSPHLHE